MQIILIGGGSSIPNTKEFWNKIQDKFVCGINYAYHFFDPVCLFYIDNSFYLKNKDDIDKLPLVIARSQDNRITHNTYFFQSSVKYTANPFKEGIYHPYISGLFALTVCLELCSLNDEIFLLGYDFGDINKDKVTHFYDIKHTGNGNTKVYERNPNHYFDTYKAIAGGKKVKIWNVSPKSRIDSFDKIDYNEFYSKLDSKYYDINVLRQIIKSKIEV